MRPGAPYGKGGLAVFFARGAGSWISFRVPVNKSGRWRIGCYFARASDLGRYQLSASGRPLGPVIDFFNGTDGWGATHVVPTGEVAFGELDLEQGECELKFECRGKGDHSAGQFMAVDAFMLRRVENP